MKEKVEIMVGQYRHESGHPYFVYGLAKLREGSEIGQDEVIRIGVALSVAGYEETGEVKGEEIEVYKTDTEKPELLFIRLGDFETPNNVVVYEQLEKGQYPAGQLWWRPEDNFQEHFQLVRE